MGNNSVEAMIQLAQTDEYEVCIWGAGYIGKGFGKKILERLAIEIDYYCDNNSDLWGRTIVDNIKCESYERLEKRSDCTVCFLIMRSDYIGIVYEQIIKMGVKYVVTYEDLLEYRDLIQQYYPFMQRKQIAVYTCIVGDYDYLKEPQIISDDCDYYVISDKKPTGKTAFQYLDIDEFVPKEIEDNTRKNRYVKINAHKIFPQYKYSVYLDGNLTIKKDMGLLVKELPVTKIAVAGESYWDNVYVEGIRCIESKRDKKEIIMKQVEQYWLSGMPEHFGSFLLNVLAREHNHPFCVKIMEDWWEQLSQYSRRDQLSFPYVLWKNGFTKKDVKTLAPAPGFISEYWEFEHEHNMYRIGKIT